MVNKILKDKLEKRIIKSQEEIKQNQILIKLIDSYPDLKIYSNRWNKEYFYSKLINEIVTDVEFANGCGCCADTPLYAKFFVDIDGIKVYADPVEICIGEGSYNGSGYINTETWRDILVALSINKNIFNKVEKYLEDNKFEPYEDDED